MRELVRRFDKVFGNKKITGGDALARAYAEKGDA